MGIRELFLGKQVHCVLVLVPVVEPGRQPEFVERAAEERRLAQHAGHPDVAGRLEVNFVERGREIICAETGTILTGRFHERRGRWYR